MKIERAAKTSFPVFKELLTGSVFKTGDGVHRFLKISNVEYHGADRNCVDLADGQAFYSHPDQTIAVVDGTFVELV